jgi:hypothetical protein
MPGEAGPVGIVENTGTGGPSVINTQSAHGLADGERVRISTGMYYVKISGATAFSAFSDATLTKPATLNGVLAGDAIDRLNLEDWAIIAGINRYPAFTCLQGPVRDAREFKRWAMRRGFVPEDQLMLVQSPDGPPDLLGPAKPTILDLNEAFLELARKANPRPNKRLGRRLYIFLSGHGITPTFTATPDFREAALLAANADKISLTYHVGARAHAEWFRARGIFDEVILFADCCRDVEDNVSPAPLSLPQWPVGRNTESRYFYAFPTMLGSKAYERAFGDPPYVRGIFSYVVVNALNNPKLYNQENALLATTLEDHLYTTVPALNGKQNPIIDYPHNITEKDLVFAKWFTRARQTVKIEFVPPVPGATAELYRGFGVGPPLATHPADRTWIDDLDTGPIYKVAIQGTGRKHLFEVTGNDEVQHESV